MSEKQVNIKITANTKDFNNAIDKAQKQIESLAEVIDKLSSSKFGEKLEEQFDGLVKAVKKIEEQMTDMMDSLDDLGKAKFDKIEDQFKDIIDSGKDVNEKIEDILDLLDKVDRQDLNGLEKEFDQVYSSLKQLSTETRDSTDTMEKSFREITDEVGKFIKELNNVEDTKLENLEESIKDLDKYVDEAAESVSDFNKKTNELDNKEINDFLDSVIDITRAGEDAQDALKKAFGSLDGKNGKLDLDLSGKGKDGILSDIADGFISGTVAGNKLEKAMDGVVDSLDDVIDNMKKLDDATDDSAKSIDEWGEEYKKAENAMEKLTKEYDDLIKKQKECEDAVEESNKAQQESLNRQHELAEALSKVKKEIAECEAEMAGYKKIVDDFNNGQDSVVSKINDVNKAIEEQEKKIEDAKKAYDSTKGSIREVADQYNYLLKVYKDLKAMNPDKMDFDLTGTKDGVTGVIKNFKSFEEMEEHLSSLYKMYQDLSKAEAEYSSQLGKEDARLDTLNKEREAFEKQLKVVHDQKEAADQAANAYNGMADKLDELRKKAVELEDALEDAMDEGTIKDLQEQADRFDLNHIKKQGQEAAKELENIKERMTEINKVAQGHADEFDKQYKAYERLSKRVKEYLENEENGILLREKVAKSFKEVADSMEAVYKDSSKLSNFDLVNKTLEEAAEHIKDLNLVSTDNLQADLNRLGEIIEDKTEKIKRFKELNKEFGSDASKAAAGLDKQAKDIRDWANSADFAIEAADKLTHAWGDLSAAGEDHLKIRERSKYIDDFGRTLEENIAHIKNYYHELETLDDIYKECTDQQRAVIDDYRMWEKNKDALLEYNRAINEYMRTLRDSGGEIDTKFLDELGNFSPQKFIDNYEKMGASSVVLQKQINAVKIELLESVKAYKENAEAMKENAKAAVETAEENLRIAKSNKEAAKSQEEYLEATEKVAKAQKELADAKNKLKNFDKDQLSTLRDQIKEYNKLAEAMREIGMAAKDIEKADISKFDKSLASALGRLDTFSNDIPKTLAALKEDITAVFSDMDSLDLGDALDGLKDIGAGLFAAIPTELKVALGVATAIGVALKESAEMGIEHFSRGASTISNALSGIVGIARDIGQEIRDAFENITGMQLDFSSMIEIPIDFESQIAKVGAIAGVDRLSEDFKDLEALARELGATTRYSATEVAQAMEYMAMAGWEFEDMTRESKDGISALEAVLSLATVASMDLGQASDFVTDGLTALGRDAKDAADFVNILAAASTSSNTSVAQMQRAFTNCAPVAGTLKITMEDLSIALGLMADKGVKGAKAGTALKNLMANLSAPTEKQLAYIKQFNLEGAQQAIVTGDLIGGIKQMKSALSSLSPQQQNAVITTIAGKEALSGISALLNTTEGDMAKLEAAIRDCDGAAKAMAEDFDKTVKGSLLKLASAMQERLLQVFDKTKDSIMEVTDQLAEFFNIWNGMPQLDETQGLTGLADALEYLEEVSQGWGKAIEAGLQNAINAINDFVNNGNLDKVLQIGTNIINGICDGIQAAADDGSLGNAISGAIGKIATWFSENLDTIVDVGKEVIDAISKGISENGDEIGEVIKSVMEMQTEIDKAVAKEKWKLIGANLVTFIVEGLQSKISVFFSGLTGFLQSGITEAFGFIAEWMVKGVGTLFFDPVQAIGISIGEWLRDAIIEKVQEAFNIDISDWGGWNWGSSKKKDSKKKSSTSSTGKTPDTSSITGQSPIDIINNNLSSGKVKTDTTAASIGQGISDNIVSKLESMDASQLQALNTELQNLQTTVQSVASGIGTSFAAIQDSARTSFMGLTNIVRNQMVNCTNIMRNQMVNSANIVRNQCVNMANIFRNQFVSMANVTRNQMLNISNIIRNQAVAWSNIVSNQVTNARNALTSQFLSMAAVARTQMVNISNIIRNQAVSWANIVSNQAKNARDALTRQFMSMAAVARTQMANILSTVKSYMSQIVSQTNRTMTMNLKVNRSVNTSYTSTGNSGGTSTLSANAIYAANTASLASLAGNTGALYSSSYAMSTGGSSSSGASSSEPITIEVPLYLDGKEAARAIAKYVDGEIKTMNKRENRKRGAK